MLIWEHYESLVDKARAGEQVSSRMAERLRSPKDDEREHRRHEKKDALEILLSVQQALKQIMIAQASLDASLAGLVAAVDNAVAALATGSTATSTPDNVVAAYQSGVDAQTVRLATATPPPPTPAPAPAP